MKAGLMITKRLDRARCKLVDSHGASHTFQGIPAGIRTIGKRRIKTGENSSAQALSIGVDSFAIVERVARIEALLQELIETRETTLRVGPLELDLIKQRAKRGERTIELRAREFRLLEYMMRRSNQILTRSMLFDGVWNHRSISSANILDVYIGRLRRKVDGPDEVPMIHNVRGAGFIIRRAT